MTSWCRCGRGWKTPDVQRDIDLNERTDIMSWSQWSLTVRGDFGKFDRIAVWMLQQVKANVNDPIITDNTVMSRAEKRFWAQTHCVLVLVCKEKALQVVQQVPRGFGFEAWMLCKEFEPHPRVKSQGMRQALLSSTKSAEPVQTVHHQGNGLKVCEEATECLRTSRMCDVCKHGSHRTGTAR